MAIESGEVQWCKWAEQGETPSYVSPGLIVGGRLAPAYDDVLREGIGNQSIWSAGPMEFAASLDLQLTNESKVLLGHAIRTSYTEAAIQEIMINGGTGDHDFLIENALIRSMRVRGTPGEPVSATLDILGRKQTDAAAGGSNAAIAAGLMEDYFASVTIGAAAQECMGFEISLDNQVEYAWNLDAKSATEKRLPPGFRIKRERVELSLDLREKQTLDVDADAPTRNIAAIVIASDGTNPITFTFANLGHIGGQPMEFVTDNGDVLWRYRFRGKPGSLVIT